MFTQEKREFSLRSGRPRPFVRHDRIPQRIVTGPIGLHRDPGNDTLNNLLRDSRVLAQVRYHHFYGHVRFIALPAIIVGNHRHRRVTNFRLARALRLPQVRHAHDVISHFMIGNRLRASAEGWAFHVHISAAIMDSRL